MLSISSPLNSKAIGAKYRYAISTILQFAVSSMIKIPPNTYVWEMAGEINLNKRLGS